VLSEASEYQYLPMAKANAVMTCMRMRASQSALGDGWCGSYSCRVLGGWVE
jgi:hypothetical protein